MYSSIITHNDFDGVASAALCAKAFNVNRFVYTGPNAIINSTVTIQNTDIVCDLPYPLDCGMWFDHHEGNLQDLIYRGIAPEGIQGKFQAEKSCAQVVYFYCRENDLLILDHGADLVEKTNLIDSFGYKDVEEWRTTSAENIIDKAIKANKFPKTERFFLRHLTQLMIDEPIERVAQNPEVQKTYEQYLEEERQMLKVIRDATGFHPEDRDHQIVILDLTTYQRYAPMVKNLVMIDHPEALGVLLIRNQFMNGVKTNNLIFSLSLTIRANNLKVAKNCAEIFQGMNIGDGHPGAAGGYMRFGSKIEMESKKWDTISSICKMFVTQ